MKDYYQTLGVPDSASQADIKSAFRRLAFKYHPDTNPGNEKQAEEIFKELNEAFGVLGNKDKRQRYDFARKGQFAGAGYDAGHPGFEYSQQDIFRDIFSNPAMFNEMNRMFGQAGLRFDRDFLSRVFFGGSGTAFQFFTTPGSASRRAYKYGNGADYQQHRPHAGLSDRSPNWIERLLIKIAAKLGRWTMRTLFGLTYRPPPEQNLDWHIELELSPSEAAAGGEKGVNYERGKETKRLMVRIPHGVKSGTKIKLRGMGLIENERCGDLYLHVKVRG